MTVLVVCVIALDTLPKYNNASCPLLSYVSSSILSVPGVCCYLCCLHHAQFSPVQLTCFMG
jgi:hypothetical protein